jgi:histidyl-tRNA synthetase
VAYSADPYLVRGLDYYTRTVFEVYCGGTGAQSALCGGGRYDALVAECGGPDTPAIGFSAGVERMVAALPSKHVGGLEAFAYVVCDSGRASAAALRAAAALRELGAVETDLSLRSRKKQIQAGEKSGARFLVIAPAADEAFEVRDLQRRDEFTAAEGELTGRVTERLGD